jgi:hypothetical protein
MLQNSKFDLFASVKADDIGRGRLLGLSNTVREQSQLNLACINHFNFAISCVL